MRKENVPFQQKTKSDSLITQVKELIVDIAGTILLSLRHRYPSAKYCPVSLVKIFSIVPGFGHMFAGFYIRGIFWFLLTLPIIGAFIFVVIDVGFINPNTEYALGGMYLAMVFFSIRDVGRIVNEACSTERFVEHFKREKAAEERYKQFINRQYLADINNVNSEETTPSSEKNKKHEGVWR